MQQKFWEFPMAFKKSKWGDGPWIKEPDKAQYHDADTELPCLIARNMVGALCGYVGVNRQHPFYGLGYEDGALSFVEVHGGLTYADAQGQRREGHHSPDHFIGAEFEEGDDQDIWWFGFDCAHAGDYCPMYSEWKLMETRSYETYKDVPYVVAQNARLADYLELQMPKTLTTPVIGNEPRIVKPLGKRKIGPREK